MGASEASSVSQALKPKSKESSSKESSVIRRGSSPPDVDGMDGEEEEEEEADAPGGVGRDVRRWKKGGTFVHKVGRYKGIMCMTRRDFRGTVCG
jgi:hypothetical protein